MTDLAELAAPEHTAIVAQECQGAVIGPNAGMAVLAGEGPLRDVPDATRRHLEDLTLAFIAGGLTA